MDRKTWSFMSRLLYGWDPISELKDLSSIGHLELYTDSRSYHFETTSNHEILFLKPILLLRRVANFLNLKAKSFGTRSWNLESLKGDFVLVRSRKNHKSAVDIIRLLTVFKTKIRFRFWSKGMTAKIEHPLDASLRGLFLNLLNFLLYECEIFFVTKPYLKFKFLPYRERSLDDVALKLALEGFDLEAGRIASYWSYDQGQILDLQNAFNMPLINLLLEDKKVVRPKFNFENELSDFLEAKGLNRSWEPWVRDRKKGPGLKLNRGNLSYSSLHGKNYQHEGIEFNYLEGLQGRSLALHANYGDFNLIERITELKTLVREVVFWLSGEFISWKSRKGFCSKIEVAEAFIGPESIEILLKHDSLLSFKPLSLEELRASKFQDHNLTLSYPEDLQIERHLLLVDIYKMKDRKFKLTLREWKS